MKGKSESKSAKESDVETEKEVFESQKESTKVDKELRAYR